MNDDNLKKFFHNAQTVTLSKDEKEGILHVVLSEMESHPFEEKKKGLFLWETFFYKHTLTSALVVFLFLGGTTTTLAEKAFPGDLLYSVKTKVNEEILGFFARGSLGKAEWHIELAERRLRDALYLSNEPGASPKIKREVRQKLEEETRQAEESTENLTTEASLGVDPTLFTEKSLEMGIVEDKSSPVSFSTLRALETASGQNAEVIPSQAELEERIGEVMKKTPSLRREVLVSKSISPTAAVGLKKELLLVEKALFEAGEGLESGQLSEAEVFLQKAEKGIFEIEQSLPLVPDTSSKNDKKFGSKNKEVGNALESIQVETSRE